MKRVIWSFEDEREFLIDQDEIKEALLFGEEPLLIELNGEINLEKLNEALNKFLKKTGNRASWLGAYEFEEFFEELDMKVKIDNVPFYGEIEEYKDKVIYDPFAGELILGENFPNVQIYDYWDGSNLNTISNEGAIEYELETEGEVSLDEWDGRNMITGGIGLHESIEKITELDGEKVEGQYLLIKNSQWQGALPKGTIMTIDEVKEHLEELGRDVNEYMVRIGEVLGE